MQTINVRLRENTAFSGHRVKLDAVIAHLAKLIRRNAQVSNALYKCTPDATHWQAPQWTLVGVGMCLEISALPMHANPAAMRGERYVVPIWDWFAISDFQLEPSVPERDRKNPRTLGSV